MKMNKKLLIFGLLIIVILLSTFYSEGMTYTMKNALVNTDTNTGRLTTIDTDGNFSSNIQQIILPSTSPSSQDKYDNSKPVIDSYITTDTVAPITEHRCPNGVDPKRYKDKCYKCKSGYKFAVDDTIILGEYNNNFCAKCDDGYFPIKYQSEPNTEPKLICKTKCPENYLITPYSPNFECVLPKNPDELNTKDQKWIRKYIDDMISQ